MARPNFWCRIFGHSAWGWLSIYNLDEQGVVYEARVCLRCGAES